MPAVFVFISLLPMKTIMNFVGILVGLMNLESAVGKRM
jgi:hypothetical protein